MNQNPYINKGQIDYVPQTKVRGKIMHGNYQMAPNGQFENAAVVLWK